MLSTSPQFIVSEISFVASKTMNDGKLVCSGFAAEEGTVSTMVTLQVIDGKPENEHVIKVEPPNDCTFGSDLFRHSHPFLVKGTKE